MTIERAYFREDAEGNSRTVWLPLTPHKGTEDDPKVWIPTGKTVPFQDQSRSVMVCVSNPDTLELGAANEIGLVPFNKPLVGREIDQHEYTRGLFRYIPD